MGQDQISRLLGQTVRPFSFTGTLTGLVANQEHGFHVHEAGATGSNCKDAGGHYNPTDVSIFCFKEKENVYVNIK